MMDIEKCLCYYKILNVDTDASVEEIKKSYKKVVLLYHPDKNTHLCDEDKKRYTNIFRKIQEAYECLTNEVQRKWYDRNRKRIIEGRESSEEKNSGKQKYVYSYTNINIWKYFNNTCYNGFDDTEGGFYDVYGKLFDDIIKEENEEIKIMNNIKGFHNNGNNHKKKREDNLNSSDKNNIHNNNNNNNNNKNNNGDDNNIHNNNNNNNGDDNNIHNNNNNKNNVHNSGDDNNFYFIKAPHFGNSATCGKDIDEFYEYWSNFTTVKKVDYSYEYIKTYEYENRNFRRNLKKVSEKRSIKEKKEYNENIRSLVNHIKKYDIRYNNRIVELIEEKRKKVELRELKKKQEILKRKLLFEENKKKEYYDKMEEPYISSSSSLSSLLNVYKYNNECKDINYSFETNKNSLPNYTKDKQNVDITETNTQHINQKKMKHFTDDHNISSVHDIKRKNNDHQYFMHSHNEDEHNERVINQIIYRCEVCRKNFKSMKQYASHEKSKKHMNNFLKNACRYSMDYMFGEENRDDYINDPKCGDNKNKKNNDGDDDDDDGGGSIRSDYNNDSESIHSDYNNESESIHSDNNSNNDDDGGSIRSDYNNDSESIHSDYNNDSESIHSNYNNDGSSIPSDDNNNNNNDKDKEKNGIKVKSNSECSSQCSISNENDDILWWYKNKKKKNYKDMLTCSYNNPEENNVDILNEKIKTNDSSDNYKSSRKKKKEKKKKKKKNMNITESHDNIIKNNNMNIINKVDEDKKMTSVPISNCKNLKENIKNLKCQICQQIFDSRNKLFQHIQEKGHSAYKNVDTNIKSNRGRKKKK
ncbi:DnaJ protein, putative [Plasmodium reichenowi]|uniref:DnaJ protein, putative n=1 Tax=Plasmodium reichenowi TaxID=5854 RepID=A0A2P9DF19_PLARE|nr:DnaJ protein, putative [Plasmodium reichenowi]